MFICRICRRFYPEKISPVEHSSSETKKSTHCALIFSIFDSFKRIFSTLKSWCIHLKVMIVDRKNNKVDKVANRILDSSEDTEEISVNFRKRSKTKKIAPPLMGLQPEAISDVPERIFPQISLMPHEVPLPSSTKEELERFKADAQVWNSQNSYLSFPIDIHTHILSYLTESKDIKNTREVSERLNKAAIECLRGRAYLVKKAIAEIIQFAQLFDREIQRITESINQEGNLVRESILEDTTLEMVPHKMGYHRFQFDVKRWENFLVDLGTKVGLAVIADKFKEDCRLDLVEALAEYNIGTQTVQEDGENLQDVNSPDRFLSRIDLSTISKDLSLDRIERMNEILDEAKSTVKGDMTLCSLWSFAYHVMLPAFSQENTVSLFFAAELANKESSHWSYFYPRYLGGNTIHFDWLIGKREGDRILVPKGKGGDRQTLLRCFQTRYKSTRGDWEDWARPFEKIVIDNLLRLDTKKVDVKVKNEILENIRKIYGNDLVASIAKETKEETGKQLQALEDSVKGFYVTEDWFERHDRAERLLEWIHAHFSFEPEVILICGMRVEYPRSKF